MTARPEGNGSGVRGRPLWTERAACIGQPIEVFFPGPWPAKSTEALAVCQRCAVLDECADYGLNEYHGIWGGMTEGEREAERRSRRRLEDRVNAVQFGGVR